MARKAKNCDRCGSRTYNVLKVCNECVAKEEQEENGFGAGPSTLGTDCYSFCFDGLNGASAYEGGQLEDLQSTVNRVRESIAHLLTGLYEAGILDQKKIEYIVRGF